VTLTATTISATLAERVRDLLTPTPGGVTGPGRVGAEIELIPVRLTADGPRPVPRADTLAALRRHDPSLLDDASVSFEPGGQLELSPACSPSVTEMLGVIESAIARARKCAEAAGFVLLDAAVSPWHDVCDVELQTDQPRYRAMQDRFDAVGPDGRRMMRLTASLQVCVDLDPALLRWRVLNVVGPALSAAFAASPLLAGRRTGLRSTRSAIWQRLDATRTGFGGGQLGCDQLDAYVQFALGAVAMPLPREGLADGESPPAGSTLREWIALSGARPDDADIVHHLTTLFPPVRPHGYLEVRYLDALPRRWRDVAVCTVAALCVDERALWQALDAVPTWDGTSPSAWARAARDGVGDDSLRATACQLLRVAAAAARRAPEGWLPVEAADRIVEFASAYTAQGRCPGDDLLERHLADPLDWSAWT
jgi:glutamate--cysteine ligase